MLGSDPTEIKMYSDYKSPYAWLAFDPVFALEDRYNVKIKWRPFQLRIKGSGQRSVYSEFKVKYSYMDVRRCAKSRGFYIRGPLKIYDTKPALIGGLFAEKHGKLIEYSRETFRKFFLREFEIDQADAVAHFLSDMGLSGEAYMDFLNGEGEELYNAAQEEALADKNFGVPIMLLDGEQFWGQDRLWLLEERLQEKGLAIAGAGKPAIARAS
jgi:2-hydroxychromene-2-carboxylate isomerase